MPELPEVEIVVREINPELSGQNIINIEILWERTFRNRSISELAGQQIKNVGRQGKYIIIELSKTYLLIHLRMTGQLLFSLDGLDKKHVRMIFTLGNGKKLYFRDVRKFGRIDHVDDPQTVLENTGIDALDELNTEKYFAGLMKNRKMNIKAFLLAQKYISGVGNIYADECLFRARIHPESVTAKIPKKKISQLYKEINFVLNFAIDHMGSTISDYRDAFGESGDAQNFFQVYQRTGLPCFHCGKEIKKSKTAGRGTHFCLKCQKKYI